MLLSDAQMAVVSHGRPVPDWKLIDVPEGPQPLPAWARGLSIYWADGYGNAPSCKLKTNIDARTWPEKRFEAKGNRYLSRSGDGRAECYYHNGALRPTTLKRWQAATGELREYRQQLPQTEPGKSGGLAPGEWVEVERLATPQQEGFGGSHYDLILTDGREVTLRGPWHGPCPEGFQEVAYVNTDKELHGARDWTQRGGIGGLLIEDELFLRIFARFCPHLRIARVGKFLQPLKPEWDAPKEVMLARERQAKLLAALTALAAADAPLAPTDDLEPWTFNELTRAGLALRGPYASDWKSRTYTINDAGRAALQGAA